MHGSCIECVSHLLLLELPCLMTETRLRRGALALRMRFLSSLLRAALTPLRPCETRGGSGSGASLSNRWAPGCPFPYALPCFAGMIAQGRQRINRYHPEGGDALGCRKVTTEGRPVRSAFVFPVFQESKKLEMEKFVQKHLHKGQSLVKDDAAVRF